MQPGLTQPVYRANYEERLAALIDVVQRYTQDGLEMPELDAMIAELDRVAGMVYRESM